MKVVFMGTSEFAVATLAKLIDSPYQILGVVTQPDRPRGRGRKLMASPIKELALKYDLEVYQPVRIKDEAAIDRLRDWEPDVIVVVAYGQILPSEILDLPRLGCVNVHASLLPHYRGAEHFQRVLMAGDKVSGVSTMFMNEGLDTGDIILQKPVPIGEEMDYGEYHDALSLAGADLLIDTMAVLSSGSSPRRKQDDHRSSYAPMLTPEDEKIIWNDVAATIRNRIRALSPKPAAYCCFAGSRFKIFKSRVINPEAHGTPGEITEITPDGFAVQTGQGVLEILEVQREGKKRIATPEFLKGFALAPGDILS